jgi:hypothetical protein
MTTLRYTVAGLNLRGATKPGRQQIDITATPLQLTHAPPVTHASLQVSFDGGKTWHAAWQHRHPHGQLPSGVRVGCALRLSSSELPSGAYIRSV